MVARLVSVPLEMIAVASLALLVDVNTFGSCLSELLSPLL